MRDISIEWLRHYIDVLVEYTQSLPEGKFRDAIALRAEHALDLAQAWNEHQTTPNAPQPEQSDIPSK